MKREPQKNLNKKLSIKNLLEIVRKSFAISEPERTEKRGLIGKISIQDCLMSALAMFGMKSESLLAFDEATDDECTKNNLKTLYKLENVPSDTYMRERLDLVDFNKLRTAFLNLFKEAQRGKLIEKYYFLGSLLVSVDGTQIFESQKIHCSSCCKKVHQNGKISYYHQILAGSIVHPNLKEVIPLCPEPIIQQDGITKNDCEANALRRFLTNLKKDHPRLPFTIVLDALSANAPTINFILSLGYNYIVNVKPSANKSLFEFISGLKLDEATKVVGKNKYTFRYINDAPLNDQEEAPNVNLLECHAEEMNGKKVNKKTFSWIVPYEINKQNVYELMLGGRARWKIENETFNTLKNQGYQFEHNFGHGKKNLHTIFALVMMLAFLVDQIQEAACGLFRLAIKSKKTRKRFWDKQRMFFFSFFIGSWEDLYNSIIYGPRVALTPNSG